MLRWTIILLLIAALPSCAHRQPKLERSSTATPSRLVMTGELTEKQLLDQLPAYRSGKIVYQPDPDALSQLRSLRSNIQILVFLGTWCPDSEREVPRFLKLMELTKGVPITYQLIGLDRSKRDAFGLAEKYQIEFVPTFVVIHHNEEIGRIVESATVSLEQDLLEIIESGIGNK